MHAWLMRGPCVSMHVCIHNVRHPPAGGIPPAAAPNRQWVLHGLAAMRAGLRIVNLRRGHAGHAAGRLPVRARLRRLRAHSSRCPSAWSTCGRCSYFFIQLSPYAPLPDHGYGEGALGVTSRAGAIWPLPSTTAARWEAERPATALEYADGQSEVTLCEARIRGPTAGVTLELRVAIVCATKVRGVTEECLSIRRRWHCQPWASTTNRASWPPCGGRR